MASTAIPTVKIIPAIPGSVNVASKIVKIPTNMVKICYQRYISYQSKNFVFKNINIITKKNPTISEIKPALIESSPKSGPTVLSSTIFNGVGNAPDLNNKDKSVAS